MGQRLNQYYQWVLKEGGYVFAVRLAMKTMLSSEKALAAPDSPENLTKFKDAAKEVTGKEAPDF